MAQKNQPAVQEEQEVSNVSGLEKFVKGNQKWMEWLLVAIIVIIFGVLAINKWYLTPAKEEARGQMFNAERLFSQGDFETALNGDGNILGFKDVAEQYGNKAGKSVWFYAGVAALQTGDNDSAIKYLKKYKGKDKIMKARALCCLGDAYANLGDNGSALSYFKKAAKTADNEFAAGYMMKAALICEETGDDAQALSLYKEIQTKYPQTLEGYEVDKYISRIENK